MVVIPSLTVISVTLLVCNSMTIHNKKLQSAAGIVTTVSNILLLRVQRSTEVPAVLQVLIFLLLS